MSAGFSATAAGAELRCSAGVDRIPEALGRLREPARRAQNGPESRVGLRNPGRGPCRPAQRIRSLVEPAQGDERLAQVVEGEVAPGIHGKRRLAARDGIAR